VDRALRRWRDRGFITISYREIVICDLPALARIAGIQVRRQAWNWPAVADGGARGPAIRHQATAPAAEPHDYRRSPAPAKVVAGCVSMSIVRYHGDIAFGLDRSQ
jgi:hypothetical protein